MTQFVAYDPATFLSNRGTAVQPPFVSNQQPDTYALGSLYNGALSYRQFFDFPETTLPITETVLRLGLSAGGVGAALLLVPPAGVATFTCIGVGGNTDLGVVRTPTHVIIGSVLHPIFSLASVGQEIVYLTWNIQPDNISGTYAFDGGPSGTFSYAPSVTPADLVDLTLDGLGPTAFGDIWIDDNPAFPGITTNPIFNGSWIGPRPLFFFTITDAISDGVTFHGHSEVCHVVDQCNMSFNG